MTSSGTRLESRLDGITTNAAASAIALMIAPNRNAPLTPNAAAMKPLIGYPAPTPAAPVTDSVPITAGDRSAGR